MGKCLKFQSQKVGRRKKNRGGERLAEWRLLRNTVAFQQAKQSASTSVCDESVNADSEPSTSVGDDSVNEPSLIPMEVYFENLTVEPVMAHTTEKDSVSKLNGRRIIDVNYVFDEVKRLSDHSPFSCNFGNMVFDGEITAGLRSGFKFKCNMCNISEIIWSEEDNESKMDINTSSVAGIMAIGSSFTGLQELFGAMDIRCMSRPTFDNYHTKVADGWHRSALEEMRQAAEEETQLARACGDVDVDGVPLLTVVADASWAKRSYRTKYNSASGVAAIVGYHTRKVLYIGVKNKYCTPCARAKNIGQEATPHACFKNWTDSSSSMEAAIIGDGFRLSEQMYGVRYARLIADGDSSVYKHLIETRPYLHLTVQKTECTNHMLRNYCNKIRELATTRVDYRNEKEEHCSTITERKIIGGAMFRLRAAVTKAVQHRKSEDTPIHERIVHLKKDLLNSPSHVFGEHLKCEERNYFCKGPKPNEVNIIPQLKKSGLYAKLMTAVGYLADNARSLMEDVNSNFAEHYNSIVAKFVGGKRVNHTLKGSYQARCAAAVVSHNTNTPFYKLHKSMFKSSPGQFSKKYEFLRKTKSKSKFDSRKKCKQSRRKLILSVQKTTDAHYGEFAQKPDLTKEDFNFKTKLFLESLERSESEKEKINVETKMQHESQIWRETRRNLLTASNFAAVCKRLPYTSCEKLVSRLLYSTDVDAVSLKYGRENEVVALEELQASGVEVTECGLFIDDTYPFLGATPDGLVGEEEIVEIKCPSAAKDLTPEEAITQRKGKFCNFWSLDKNKKISGINKNHDYYFQIQGQLHVTKKDFCKFVVWTRKGIKIETIQKDDTFWQEKMEEKLVRFYKDCILPEIVDPRKPRNMPIRNPDYILEAIERRKQKKEQTKPTQNQ